MNRCLYKTTIPLHCADFGVWLMMLSLKRVELIWICIETATRHCIRVVVGWG